MTVNPILFYLFASIAIAFSLLVVLKKSPASSAFSLVVVFFALAGVYAMLDAHLIAALQVLVYAGAIMVLFVFVIMLLNQDAPSFDLGRSHPALRIVSGVLGFVMLAVFIRALHDSGVTAPSGPFTPERVAELGGNTQVVSQLMFSEYILPFELTSVLLLAGIVGAVTLAKRKRGAAPAAKEGGRA